MQLAKEMRKRLDLSIFEHDLCADFPWLHRQTF